MLAPLWVIAQIDRASPCYREIRPLPEPPLREADVAWAERVWRIIDVREKVNLPLHVPSDTLRGCGSLFDVIRFALLKEASLTAYDPGPLFNDDHFTRPMGPQQVADRLARIDTVIVADPTSGEEKAVVQRTEQDAGSITRYQIKEDWIFDKQRSELVVRIIGIAPMREVRGDDGELRGYAPLFWLYYPECRNLFAHFLAPSRSNDAQRHSFETIFRKRLFSSTVIKAGNVYDRAIGDVRTGIDAQVEGARLEQQLREFERDLWHY